MLNDDTVQITDNGRGIPVDPHPKFKNKSALEIILTTLHSGGKFNSEKHSINGNEIAWGTIGNASTSEGLFFEVVNAAGVHKVPMIINLWDDEFGISVDNSYKTTKSIRNTNKHYNHTQQTTHQNPDNQLERLVCS